MVDPLFQAVEALYVFIPAFAANSAAVLTGGYGKMDFGRNFIDGKRILGDGKTWSGYIGGTVLASILGLILYSLMLVFPLFANYPDPLLALYGAALLSAGSLTGDAFGSFIKRRIGIQRGG
ncbi:Phosphatidate cytidylyltransferase, partial [mine drainage metagenome]